MAKTIAGLALRPATLDDAAFAADVETAVHPHRPRDPMVYRYWWAQPDEYIEIARFVVTRDGEPVGVGEWSHPRWGVQPDRYGTVGAEILPAHRDVALLDAAIAELEQRVIAEGARVLRGWSNEDDLLRIEMLLARGYVEDRRSKRWELDLVANRDRLLAMADESRARMRAEGIRILTLADDDDPSAIEKIWRLSEEAVQDVPTTVPHVPEAMAGYVRWVNAPEIHRDRFWIARTGAGAPGREATDEIVGVSVLGFPPTRGVVGTEWTGTARSVRGRGVARALKCETVAQAIALGVDRVRTGNDAANAPILHINETMGYRRIAGSIQFLRRV